MNGKYYFYEFKHGMHCICAGYGIEYLGVKGTADSKELALSQIVELNKSPH